MPILLPAPILDNGVWVQTWATSPSLNQTGLENYSFRCVALGSNISRSGSLIRVTFTPHSTAQLKIDNASIVERSGSTDAGTTTPTSLLFSGSASVTTGSGTPVTSDPLAFNIDETKDYLVIFDIGSTLGNCRYHVASDKHYFKVATDSYNVQTPTGFTDNGTGGYCASKIEVLT